MKHTISEKVLADFTATNGPLPFDSITFEFSDVHNNMLVNCTATKTVEIDAINMDYDTLEKLSKLAIAEHEAKQLAQDLKYVTVPTGLTDAQVKAVIRKYKQNCDGTPNLAQFFNRVSVYGDYAGLQWCGMFLGIERDGYTHS